MSLFLDFILLCWSICLFLHQCHSVFITLSYNKSNSSSIRPSSLFFFLKKSLAILSSLNFHINFSVSLLNSTRKKVYWKFLLAWCWACRPNWKTYILIALSHPIYECYMYLHLLRISLISFSNALSLSESRSYITFIFKFILKYFRFVMLFQMAFLLNFNFFFKF